MPGEGPVNAKIAVVGEAPGQHEEDARRPFIGPSGKMVDELLANAGVKRLEVYVTNVVKIRPPNNDIKSLHLLGKSIEDFLPQLWSELESLKPNVVLAFGNTALTALTGKTGIEKYRGSILSSLHGYPKVIATIHPASLMHKEADGRMRSWKDKVFIQWDVNRAVAQSKFRDLRLPDRNLVVCHNSLDLYRFLDRFSLSKLVAVDIETFRTIPICIGLAFSRNEAISIPLLSILSEKNPNGIPRSDLVLIWKELVDLLSNPHIQKIGQNFKFDETLLKSCLDWTVNFGLKVYGFFFDTMLGFKTLYPELPGRLQFITSVLTEEPYYKDEGKEYNPKKDKFDRLLLYNAKDAVVTFESYEEELKELRARNLDDFFFTRVMPLHPFYSRMERRGIKRDDFQQKFLLEKYELQLKDLQEELDNLTKPYEGTVVNANSSKQVCNFLYGVLNIPARKGADEKTLDALSRNTVKDKTKLRVIQLILKIRKVRKTIGTYINAEVDYRGRFLTGTRLMLETGRTSTSVLEPPITTKPLGLAFQTITKHGDTGADIRSMFVPDPGYVFIEPDFSAAEARVVAFLARDDRLIKLFKYEVDIHRITESWIVGRSPDRLLESFYAERDERACQALAKEINKKLKETINELERQEGKKFRHAGHYDMGKREAARQVGCSEYHANKILQKFHDTNPNIRNVFHKEIIESLRANNRTLVNPFGRTRQFLNKWGEDLFKEAYAQTPQSTVSDQTKFAMIRIESRAPWIEILEESHDSFLAQVRIEDIERSIPIIKEEMERPIDFSLCSLPRGELVIPCEIKIGRESWEKMEKLV